MSTPTMTTAGLQQGGGAAQTLTVAGMEAMFALYAAAKTCKRGKRKLMAASEEDLIRTARRSSTTDASVF